MAGKPKVPCPKCGNEYGSTYIERHMQKCKGTNNMSTGDIDIDKILLDMEPEAPPETPPEAPPETPPETPPEAPPETPPETPQESESGSGLGIIGAFAMMVIVVLGVLYYFTRVEGDDSNE